MAEKKAKEEERIPEVPDGDRRIVMIELSCAHRHCSPCTYPNCQRYVRETKRKKPVVGRVVELSAEEFERVKRRLSGVPRSVE
ncbi:MAG: hypothetical protein ACUVV6_01525 [Thermoplasmatota archaeon]